MRNYNHRICVGYGILSSSKEPSGGGLNSQRSPAAILRRAAGCHVSCSQMEVSRTFTDPFWPVACEIQSLRESEMTVVAGLIDRVLRGREDEGEIAAVRDEVRNLCSKFAPYP